LLGVDLALFAGQNHKSLGRLLSRCQSVGSTTAQLPNTNDTRYDRHQDRRQALKHTHTNTVLSAQLAPLDDATSLSASFKLDFVACCWCGLLIGPLVLAQIGSATTKSIGFLLLAANLNSLL
jgi:hypothetical protein